MTATASLLFLLSPAHCGGKRAGYLLNPAASFELAVRLRTAGITLGQAFSFLSGLYFRGKLAYAARFARPSKSIPPALVITSNRGLLPPDTLLTRDALCAMGSTSIDVDDPLYRGPLERDARHLAATLGRDASIVLLGSVATAKYAAVLAKVFGGRLLFPADFVGRGDMSRGALMLRAVEKGHELPYIPLLGAARTGPRAGKIRHYAFPPANNPGR